VFALIVSLIQGIISGVAAPLASVLNKRSDITLAGYQAGTDADRQNYATWVQYQIQLQALKVQASNWWGPKALYMIVGSAAAVHCAAIFLDSTFLFNWHVAKCPAPYDSYEQMVVGSLFITTLASGPLSAASAWLHRK
jgi:hypothetical protein